MAQLISCKQFQSFLVSQEPVYDREILRDVRPTNGDLMGYYLTGQFDAYSGTQHTFDRFNSVFPDLTQPWRQLSGASCVGTPCDPPENKLGWGWTRGVYNLEEQSWGSNLLCFDQIMTKTKAKEHFRYIIDQILRPATSRIMSHWLMLKAAELAEHKWVANSAMTEFTFTWDAGGNVYMNATAEPTSKLTPNMLRSRVYNQYLLGAIEGGAEGYDRLELHTDVDTLHALQKEDPYLKELWRFGDFGPANKEYWKYGFTGWVGDYMVKTFRFPVRFNKISATRYQVVFPYKNVAADEGIKSIPNPDYQRAQYQWSFINNRRAIRVLPFNPEAVNQTMPFLVRDFGGKWRFVMNDLGADASGRAIDNSRGNKGKFIADFRLAAKPEHPEWMELIFHLVDRPCITEIGVCNAYPGYPAQVYESSNDVCACPQEIQFTAIAGQQGAYGIGANSIIVNGSVITHGAVAGASVAAFVAALQIVWNAASQPGTWSVVDAAARTIKISYAADEIAADSIELPFVQ
ncbi:MAG: hypothetical protein IT581_12155 [Verrucomicrobiales bacterium]|nr:hypothetical protein [Verrucomicrobiales bacterium]